GALEPERAVDLAGRLPVAFLADVAAELDPRRIGGVLTTLAPARIVAVAGELVRRADFVTMGRFVGELPSGLLRATVVALPAEALLRTAVFSENDDRFPELFAMVTDDRIPSFVDVFATVDDELSADLLPLLAYLDETGLARMAAVVADLPPAKRTRFAVTASRAGLTGRLGPLGVALNG
nr:hypothetical protein [Actinomycetota bacterium]